MKIARLRNLKRVVEEILRKSELAREDDCYLILRVVQKLYPKEAGRTFANVMLSAKYLGISFERHNACKKKGTRKIPSIKRK